MGPTSMKGPTSADHLDGAASAVGNRPVTTVEAMGFGLVHILLIVVALVIYGYVIFVFLPMAVPGPVSWQTVVEVGLPIASSIYLFIVFGALRGKATGVRIEDSGVVFIRRWMKPDLVPWKNLEPPQQPSIMSELCFTKLGDAGSYWVPPNIARAILTHPSSSWDGVAPDALKLLGLRRERLPEKQNRFP